MMPSKQHPSASERCTMPTKRVLVAVAASVLLASCCLACAQRPAAPPPSIKDQLIGTWRLVARDVVRPDGTSTLDPAYGPKYPIGYIMYYQTRHIALQFLNLDPPTPHSS